MRIGFDGKRAVQNFTGLGNYSRYIVDILCQFYPENEYVLYAPKKRENKRLDKLTKQYQQLQLSYPTTSSWKKLSSLWRVWGVTQQLEKEKIDIFHGLSNELPLNIHQSEVKSIVTIHDLIFLRYPQYYHSIDRKIYTYKFRKACENADRIIAISECTKRDIIEYFGIPADKIEVVYQGCDPSFMHPVAAEKKREIRAKYQLPDHYILNVGSIEERKNALSAVQALTMLPEQIHLVIVGRHTEYTDKIERFIKENKLEERVHIISNVPFDDLPAFYQLAEIFVYPSRFEGFGIPIIEALYSGIPVVAATGSCLEEAGGPDSIYVHPDDIKNAIRPNTKFVVVTHCSNVLGTIQPLTEIGKICKEKGVIFVVDGSQGAGAVDLDMQASGIDVYCFTGHKCLMGPTGIGGSYVREGIEIKHTRAGGTGVRSAYPVHLDEYPYRLEYGTLNLLGVAGLNAGVKWIQEQGIMNIHHREILLWDKLRKALQDIEGVTTYCASSIENQNPVLSFNINGFDSGDVGTMLDVDYNIAVRTGLQCAPKVHEVIGTFDIHGTVRMSIGAFTTEEDVNTAIEAVKANSQKVNGSADIARVGAVSSGDEGIGQLIAEAMEKVGHDGVITIE